MEYRKPVRILLVEDSEEDGLVLAAHLKAKGLLFDLTRVEELEPLRAALASAHWDILLTDFALPTMDGLGVLKEAMRLAPALPCIVVSGQISEEAAVESLRAGAKDFISKFRLARLIPAIQRELDESCIRAGADLYRGIFERMDQGCLHCRVVYEGDSAVDWIYLEVNPAFYALTGLEDVVGRKVSEIIPGVRETSPDLFEIAGRVARNGAAETFETFMEVLHIWCSIFVYCPAQGEFIALFQNITNRKLAEEKVHQSQAHLDKAQELAQLGSWEHDLVSGEIYWSDGMFRILGLEPGSMAPSYEYFLQALHPEDRGRVELAMNELHDRRAPYFMDYRIFRADGVLRHIHAQREVERDGAGIPVRTAGTLLDVTRLKETEEALRRTESLFSSIHRHVVDLVAIIDGEGHRGYTSPSYQFVLGYSEKEIAALSSMELLHPEDYPRVTEALRSLMEGRPTQGLEYRLRHKDGRWLYFESTAALIPDPSAGSLRALVVARDITERKEAEQSKSAMEVQLRQAQKLEAIGQLASGIAHEINTPTQYIGDNTTFLRDSFNETFSIMGRLVARLMDIQTMGGAGGEAARKVIQDLAGTDLDYLGKEIPKAIQQSLDGVGRISKIVKAMKDFSHPGGESKTLADLHQAIESTITVSRNEWKYAANLVTDFDPALPPVPCYPGEFNQVILNLIVNAAHAIESAKGGRDSGILGQITVKTRAMEDEVEVSVSDDGTGIPEAIQARMFEPFFTTKPVGKGSGQGLSIVHAAIVEKHQGRIEVRSEEGKGTTFNLYLPLKDNSYEEGAE